MKDIPSRKLTGTSLSEINIRGVDAKTLEPIQTRTTTHTLSACWGPVNGVQDAHLVSISLSACHACSQHDIRLRSEFRTPFLFFQRKITRFFALIYNFYAIYCRYMCFLVCLICQIRLAYCT